MLFPGVLARVGSSGRLVGTIFAYNILAKQNSIEQNSTIKKSNVARAKLRKDFLARRKALISKHGIARWLRKGFVEGAQGISCGTVRT